MLEEGNVDGIVISSWKVKESKNRGSKRVKLNWVSRIDDDDNDSGDGEEKYSGGEDEDDGNQEFDMENLEQNLIHLMQNLGVEGKRRSFKGREHHGGIELSRPSDIDVRD